MEFSATLDLLYITSCNLGDDILYAMNGKKSMEQFRASVLDAQVGCHEDLSEVLKFELFIPAANTLTNYFYSRH